MAQMVQYPELMGTHTEYLGPPTTIAHGAERESQYEVALVVGAGFSG
jgi:hypothetical protein